MALMASTLYHLVTHAADSVARRNLTEACKPSLDVRLAGNVACWVHSCDAAWGFSDALKSVDACGPVAAEGNK